MYVPVDWTFVSDADAEPETSSEGQVYRRGEYVPDPSSLTPVSEIIDPSGPIAFVGNYAVFRMKSSYRNLGLNDALDALRLPYLSFHVTIDAGNNLLVEVCPLEPLWERCTYNLTFAAAGVTVVRNVDGVNAPIAGDQIHIEQDDGVTMIVEGIAFRFSQMPAAGNYVVSIFAGGSLRDPEEKLLCLEHRLPKQTEEDDFFGGLLDDMKVMLPTLQDILGSLNWTDLSAEQKDLVRGLYREYLIRRENTTEILLESNNTYLDLEVGTQPALEKTQRLARIVEVLDALEEYEQGRIDNVTVVGTAEKLRSLIGELANGGDNV